MLTHLAKVAQLYIGELLPNSHGSCFMLHIYTYPYSNTIYVRYCHFPYIPSAMRELLPENNNREDLKKKARQHRFLLPGYPPAPKKFPRGRLIFYLIICPGRVLTSSKSRYSARGPRYGDERRRKIYNNNAVGRNLH